MTRDVVAAKDFGRTAATWREADHAIESMRIGGAAPPSLYTHRLIEAQHRMVEAHYAAPPRQPGKSYLQRLMDTYGDGAAKDHDTVHEWTGEVSMPFNDAVNTVENLYEVVAATLGFPVRLLMGIDTAMVEQPKHDPAFDKKVTDVLDHIVGGKSTAGERKALKGAIDKTEAPLTGRAKSDHAMGRALRFGGNGEINGCFK
jgi:hypothetical protein